MPPQLPPEMKAKFVIVRRRHNRVALPAAFLLISPMLAYLRYGPASRPLLFSVIAGWAAVAIVYFVWLYRYDGALCREVGLLCPYCSRPLYQGGPNDFSLLGKCPKCKRSVMTSEDLTNRSSQPVTGA
jgi:hypothetical protein